jgi:hypothetical protein
VPAGVEPLSVLLLLLLMEKTPYMLPFIYKSMTLHSFIAVLEENYFSPKGPGLYLSIFFTLLSIK